MTTTTMISIRVKPLWRLRIVTSKIPRMIAK
jgi:hypothetical protein